MYKQLNVKSNIQDYSVYFSNDFSIEIEKKLSRKNFYIIDQNVFNLYKDKLKAIVTLDRYSVIEAKEIHKSIDHVKNIIKDLLKANFKKNHSLVAIGGGIIQDITGFISSIMFRGVDWYFFPTTLLAQSDSCIGSKTSINVDEYKNQLGTFHPPKEIYLDVNFLKTLKDDDIKSGLGEILKVHLLDSVESMQEVNSKYEKAILEFETMTDLIYRSLEIKKRIIEIDEFDKDYRNIMNYGHTFGHAIESVANYEISHGQAVTIGLDMDNYISFKMGLITKNVFSDMSKVIVKNWPKFDLNKINLDNLYLALSKDKKNIDASVTMILTKGPGQMFKKSVQLDDSMKKIIKNYFDEHSS